MNQLALNRLCWLIVPLCNCLFQIALKHAALNLAGEDGHWGLWLGSAMKNPWLWLAIACEIAAFGAWMRILAHSDLSRAFPLSAVSYLLVMAAGWFLFDETLAPLQIVGAGLIVSGVLLIGSAPRATPSQNPEQKDVAPR
jgi:drug/metabolite transporter (DMT)-like permease